MSKIYFFKNDGMCKFMKSEIKNNFSRYVQYSGNNTDGDIKYYVILKWNAKSKGFIEQIFKEGNYRYVYSIDELPEKSGVYVAAYDANLEELNLLKEKNIPVIEKPCPWLAKMKNELINYDEKYQYLLLLKSGHIIYNNYKSIFPPESIFFDIDNYEQILNDKIIKKPVFFMPYATIRKKEALKISDFINKKFPNPLNKFYMDTTCGWVTKQGIIEEIQFAIKEKKLDEIWIITNTDDSDTSMRSILMEVKENGALPVLIKKIEDIPKDTGGNKRIGCLMAPMPFSSSITIKLSVRRQYNEIIK